MEIGKFITEGLKDGSIEKVSQGIEQLVMMMINAIGMIEKRELEFEKRLETFEEDIDVIKSFLLSKPIPLPGSTPPSPASESPTHPTHNSAESHSSPSIPVTKSPTTPESRKTPILGTPSVNSGPSEDDIIAFRKKLLKPAPKHEKPKAEPISIRSALMQEMKQYFGSAMNKVKKEKPDP